MPYNNPDAGNKYCTSFSRGKAGDEESKHGDDQHENEDKDENKEDEDKGEGEGEDEQEILSPADEPSACNGSIFSYLICD